MRSCTALITLFLFYLFDFLFGKSLNIYLIHIIKESASYRRILFLRTVYSTENPFAIRHSSTSAASWTCSTMIGLAFSRSNDRYR